MFYHLIFPLRRFFFGFNVFQYITFRSGGAFATALFIGILLGYWGIPKLRRMKVGQTIQKELPNSHHTKQGTPTMGGIFILASIVISTLLWARLDEWVTYLSLASVICLGGLGFVDDYIKVAKRRSLGLKARYKIAGQLAFGLGVALYLYFSPVNFIPRPGGVAASYAILNVPFLRDLFINLSFFYIPFAMIVIVGASNAVNLTDGLDGLATGTVIAAVVPLAIMAYVTGNKVFSEYLLIDYIPGSGEITVFCASMIGACMGFLWFNAHPAEVIMGDTGALSLGGALGVIAVTIRQELLLVVIGGIFVIEALSVIIQLASYRLRGKPFFKMAPIHHHFELMGIPESKIVARFLIVGSILALISLLTLKVR
ncbi:MAG: phospho-N-acetylmuramoyl-pentapeptide-transferase [bacterium]